MQYLTLLRRYPNYLGFGLLHYFFSSPGQSFFISVFVAYLTGALGIGQEDFNGIYALATLGSAFTLPWLGSLLDRTKLRHFSVALGLVYTGFCLLMASVQNLYMLFLAIYGLRLCGQGLMGLTASTATARYFDQMRGQALSLVSLGVSLGEMTLPLLFAGLVLTYVSWQVAWLIVAGLVLLVFVPLSIGLVRSDAAFQYNPAAKAGEDKPDAKEEQAKTASSVSRGQVLRRPSFYVLSLCYLWPPFFMTGIIINLTLIGEANDWSPGLLATGISVLGGMRLLANLFSGPLIDRFTAVRVFAFMLLPMLLGTALLAWSSHPVALIGFFVLSGISVSLNGIASTAVWAELYGIRFLGAIRSMVSTFMVVSTAAAPLALGWALQATGNQSLVLWLCCLLMGGITLITFWQTGRLRKGLAE